MIKKTMMKRKTKERVTMMMMMMREKVRERKLGFDTHFALELGSEEEEGEVTTSIILITSICSL